MELPSYGVPLLNESSCAIIDCGELPFDWYQADACFLGDVDGFFEQSQLLFDVFGGCQGRFFRKTAGYYAAECHPVYVVEISSHRRLNCHSSASEFTHHGVVVGAHFVDGDWFRECLVGQEQIQS